MSKIITAMSPICLWETENWLQGYEAEKRTGRSRSKRARTAPTCLLQRHTHHTPHARGVGYCSLRMPRTDLTCCLLHESVLCQAIARLCSAACQIATPAKRVWHDGLDIESRLAAAVACIYPDALARLGICMLRLRWQAHGPWVRRGDMDRRMGPVHLMAKWWKWAGVRYIAVQCSTVQ